MGTNKIVGTFTSSGSIRDLINNCTYNYKSNEPEPAPSGIRFRVEVPEINFIGRSMHLYDLKQFFSATTASPPSIVVVSGMGGMGKTQLVRKFIDENQSKYENIVWIDSENDEAITNSFKKLLEDRLDERTKNANGNEKDAKSVIEQVLKKLCQRKTLFIYDNVESTKSINFVLAMVPPLGVRPHIVITSQLQKWADGIKVIQLTLWTMAESIEYISKVLQDSKKDSEDDKIALAEKLQHFPLALRQATAFINLQRDTSDNFKISDYLKRYTRNACKMLDSVVFQECSTNPYQKTTYTTWSITTEAIQADKLYGKLAIKIFKMIAYFVADDIKRDFFVHLAEIDDVNEQFDYEEDLKSAVNLLVNYSMIDSRDKQRIFSVHRLVQDVTKLTLKASHEEEQTLRNALQLISKLISRALDTHGVERSIPLHFISVFLSALQLPELIKEFVSLTDTILQLFEINGKYDLAIEFGVKIVGPLIDVIGPNDRLLLQIQFHIAMVYLRNSMFDQALQMNLAILDKQKMHFGAEDYDTLKTLCQVADSYEACGDDESAVHWYEKVLEKQKINLHENHPDMLETMCKIAFSIKELGRHDAALQLYEDVFVQRKALFEPTRIPRLVVNENLIYIWNQIGDRVVKLRTHSEFLTQLTGWTMSDDRRKPSTLAEKQNLRKGVFFHLSSTTKQFIHTHDSTTTYFRFWTTA